MKLKQWHAFRAVAGLAVALSALATGAGIHVTRPVAYAQTPSAWTSIGPTGGRVTAVAVNGAGKLFVGTEGGVWISADNGKTWTTSTDQQPANSVNDLALDPTNASTVYAGTSGGVLKSIDGGSTWTIQNPNGIFSNGFTRITAIAVDPRGALYVATSNGLYVSIDGGSTFPNQPLQNQSISSLQLDGGTNPTTVYIAVRGTGVEKSTDGTNFTVLGGGLPAGAQFGNTSLAMAPSNHQVLYVSIGQAGGNNVLVGIYKSTDGGTTWANLPNIVDFTGYGDGTGQAFANNVLTVKPDDPNTVWGGGVHLASTNDGGTTWVDRNARGLATGNLGLDYHAFAWDAQGNLYAGSDFSVSELTRDGRVQDLTGNVTAKLFYAGASQFENGTLVQGGTQDNGDWLYLGNGNWKNTRQGDGSGTGIDSLNPSVMVAQTLGSLAKTTDQWQTNTNVTPQGATGGPFIKISAAAPPNGGNTDAPVLFYGASQIFTSPDGGATWTAGTGGYNPTGGGGSGVTAIATAPSNPQVVYVGFTDGTVEVSNDQGNTWTVMTALPGSAPNCNNCAGQNITHIAVNATDATQVTVTFGGSFSGPHVVQGTNANTATPTWTDVTGNLPNEQAWSVVYNGAGLIVGTAKGVYSGTPSGANTTWVTTAPGLPKVPVRDLLLAPNGTLTALTYGRSAWQTVLPAISPNGAGTITVTPATAKTGATGLTFTFTYTAATGGLNNGEVDVSVPSAWPAPTATNATVSAGTLGFNNQTIAVTGLTLGAGQTLTVTYGANGNTITAPSTLGNYTFTTRTMSVAGTPPLVAVAGQPAILISPAGGTVPAAPTNVTIAPGVCNDGSGQLTASWGTPPFDGGSAITTYEVSFVPPGATNANFFDVGPPSTTFSWCGFDKTLAYTATVWAVNGNGNGPKASSSTAVTPAAKAPPPTDVQTVVGNGNVDVMWQPPASDNGGVITSYTVIVKLGNSTVEQTTVPYFDDSVVLTGLSNGTPYSIEVTANNEYGPSSPADFAGTVDPSSTPNVPDPPTDVLAHAGNAKATVSWTAPNDNGSPITKYTVTAHPGDHTAVVTGTPGSVPTATTVTGLTNGVGYYFTVVATSGVGDSLPSDPSPYLPNQLDQGGMTNVGTVAAAPTGVRAFIGNGQATVSWDPPTSDGGFEVGTYIVIASPGNEVVDVDGSQYSAIVPGLHNGTAYTFKVIAVNDLGEGPASSSSAPVTPHACMVVNGSRTSLTLRSGVSCVTGRINGSLSVKRGATAWISSATITGGLTAIDAASVRICDSSVGQSAFISNTTGFVLLGDSSDDDCAGNTFASLTLSSNHSSLDLWGNIVGGTVTISSTTGSGPATDDFAPEVGYNDIHGTLSCTANKPLPVDEGNPNFVTGAKLNQCAGL